jgi:hypothetical protein
MSATASLEKPQASQPILDRPFYFIVVVWGERFCDYLLEYCIPSLLAPGNAPALRTATPSKFLIATQPHDWERMRKTAIFKKMEQYLSPVYFEIPPCPPNLSGCEHMGVGHKLCCELAFREKAYAIVLTPDAMLSDGTVAHLQSLASSGAELVLAAALRFGEEPFLGKLRNIGAIPAESRRQSGKSLAIDARTMVAAALDGGFHSETMSYEFDAPYFFAQLPSAVWWRVPGEDGIILHSLSWAPLLFDYNSVDKHDTSTLENWTIDGDYLYKNFGSLDTVRIIRDSDDAFLASWGPLSDRPRSLAPNRLFKLPFFGDFLKGYIFSDAFYGPVFDPLKRKIFFHSVFWHARPLNNKWKQVDARLSRKLAKMLNKTSLSYKLTRAIFLPPYRMAIASCSLWKHRRAIMERLSEVLQGDTKAARRVVSRMSDYRAFLIGKRGGWI